MQQNCSQFAKRLVFFVMLVSAVCLASGCGKKPDPTLDTFPVNGSILVNGKPPVRAEIRLKPKVPLKDPLKRSVEPYAYVQADGSFEVCTYKDRDGAPVGDYSVTVVWPEVKMSGGEEAFGPDRLGNRFANPQAPVTTVTVIEGSNLIPEIKIDF